MIAQLIRLIKRFAILVPGMVIAYFAAIDIYPTIDRQLPWGLAILATYGVTAYVLIPAGLRLVRLIIKPKHIPLYVTSPDGLACDPVNIGVVGTREELVNVFKKAGWHQADQRNFKTLTSLVLATLLKKPYPSAPFSSMYLFGRSQDIGFQLPGNTTSQRHHVRFWAATYTPDSKYRDHIHFWQKHHRAKHPDLTLWVGAVSLDAGWAIIRHNGQITHMIHPDTNAEREFTVNALKKTGLVKRTNRVTVGLPYKTANRSWMAYMHADGKMAICELKPYKASIPRAKSRSRSVTLLPAS